jgi:hypothetical protein
LKLKIEEAQNPFVIASHPGTPKSTRDAERKRHFVETATSSSFPPEKVDKTSSLAFSTPECAKSSKEN